MVAVFNRKAYKKKDVQVMTKRQAKALAKTTDTMSIYENDLFTAFHNVHGDTFKGCYIRIFNN